VRFDDDAMDAIGRARDGTPRWGESGAHRGVVVVTLVPRGRDTRD
jgi:hypothetical protein